MRAICEARVYKGVIEELANGLPEGVCFLRVFKFPSVGSFFHSRYFSKMTLQK